MHSAVYVNDLSVQHLATDLRKVIICHIGMNRRRAMLCLFSCRLQSGKTAKYTRGFMRFVSVIVLHLGVKKVGEILEKVQEGIFFMILEQIWLPSFLQLQGNARKLCCMALIKILTECTPLISQSPALWGKLLEVLIKTLEGHSFSSRSHN